MGNKLIEAPGTACVQVLNIAIFISPRHDKWFESLKWNFILCCFSVSNSSQSVRVTGTFKGNCLEHLIAQSGIISERKERGLNMLFALEMTHSLKVAT